MDIHASEISASIRVELSGVVFVAPTAKMCLSRDSVHYSGQSTDLIVNSFYRDCFFGKKAAPRRRRFWKEMLLQLFFCYLVFLGLFYVFCLSADSGEMTENVGRERRGCLGLDLNRAHRGLLLAP